MREHYTEAWLSITYVNNVENTDYDLGGFKNESFRGSLRFTPNDTTEINFSVFHSKEHIDSLPISIGDNNCGEYNKDTIGARHIITAERSLVLEPMFLVCLQMLILPRAIQRVSA